MKNNICILIPIYNRIETTKIGINNIIEGLNQLNDQSNKYFSYRVIVIDDGSTDGSSEWIISNIPGVNIVKGNGNLWWTGSINLGIKYATEHIQNIEGFLFWNDDTLAGDNYFSLLSEVVHKNIDSIIGNIVLEKKQSDVIHSFGGSFNNWTGFRRYNYKGKLLTEISEVEKWVDWIPGMGMYVPISIYETIGKLDEKKFPQYFGDINYCLRAKNAGFKIIVDSRLKILNDSKLTGLARPTTISAVYPLLFSNRSKYNVKQNFRFSVEHGYFPLSLMGFIRNYFFLARDSFKTLLKYLMSSH